jgi:NAD(P)-dependent dehydrogenase (short-subunit alcohol dehydrogenase family)
MMRLENKVALITSIDDRIGFAAAKLFAKEGAHVFITGRYAPQLAEDLKGLGIEMTEAEADVSKLPDLDRLLARIKREKGRLDIIFANTGGPEQNDHSILETHVKGLFFVMQKSLPLFTDGASVILNTSFASSDAQAQPLILAAASASIRSFGRTWAVELRSRFIRVNVVSPNHSPASSPHHQSTGVGDIDPSRVKPNGSALARPSTSAEVAEAVMSLVGEDSELSGSELLMEGGKAHLKKLSEESPPGKPGTLDEVARNILYLASDDSRHLTGIELFVDMETKEL